MGLTRRRGAFHSFADGARLERMIAVKIDPFAQRVLDLIAASARPPFETLEPAVARELYRAGRLVLQPDLPAVAALRDLAAPGPDGPIPLRLYRGAGTVAGAILPALIYYHGGGWVLGDLESHDGICRAIANAAGCAVVAVDYRLAPEHKFPAAVDDAVAATRFVAAQAGALGIDGTRLAVGGDSAGATLAAVACLAARDGGGPALRFQVLVYPATDLTMESAAHREFTADLPLTHGTMLWFRDHYLRSAADRSDWRASPLRASDLAGLPPALVITAGLDPLRDEGDAYARRLAEAGVAVTHRCFAAQIHGFLAMGRIVPAAQEAIGAVAAALRRSFEN
jgi:acetyl esterase